MKFYGLEKEATARINKFLRTICQKRLKTKFYLLKDMEKLAELMKQLFSIYKNTTKENKPNQFDSLEVVSVTLTLGLGK